jgi:hypothetical protein
METAWKVDDGFCPEALMIWRTPSYPNTRCGFLIAKGNLSVNDNCNKKQY